MRLFTNGFQILKKDKKSMLAFQGNLVILKIGQTAGAEVPKTANPSCRRCLGSQRSRVLSSELAIETRSSTQKNMSQFSWFGLKRSIS